MIAHRGLEADLAAYQQIIAEYRAAVAANPTAIDPTLRTTALTKFRALGVGEEFAGSWLDPKPKRRR
jgi:hypothetical protein